jgi:hypothetical protein
MERSGARIFECQAEECSYNVMGKCRTIGINVGGPDPLCDTFVETGVKGGLIGAITKVGACKVGNCVHNEDLECMADGIRVVYQNDRALCSLYQSQI